MLMLIIYFLTFVFVKKFKEKHRLKFKPFPNLTLKKNGIVFVSKLKHRIKINNQKYLQIENQIYLKTREEVVVIENVCDVFKYEDFLYFSGLGTVKIIFNCKSIYKYFNLEIKSEKFSLDEQKQSAILDIINNNFQINFSKILKNYIKNIKNILNIQVFSKKIIIKQNKFHLPFILKYKLNSKIKKFYINETLEEN